MYERFEYKKIVLKEMIERVKLIKINLIEENLNYLVLVNLSLIYEGVIVFKLFERFEFKIEIFKYFLLLDYNYEIYE